MDAQEMTGDVIVIGAGTSGSVVIRRLLDAGLSVTAIEGGPADDSELIHNPTAAIGLWGGPYDWAYSTVPQPRADGRQLMQPRGKTLGGSTAINAMMYVRGLAADYDAWAQGGAAGWRWSDVEPYFRRLEDYDGPHDGNRGTGGPFRVQAHPGADPLNRAFVQAAEQAGFGYNRDYNSGDSQGVSFVQTAIRDGRRETAWTAYGRPVEDHPRLTLITGAHVVGLIVDGSRVTGVQYRKDGRLWRASAQETVLAAGAVNSPQLLLLSGIGPAAELQRLGIPVVLDLPGVGKNLQDHVNVPIGWAATGTVPEPVLQRLEAHLFARTRPGLLTPDVQDILVSAVLPTDGPMTDSGFSAATVLLHPLSRGEVTLRSADPAAAPLIDPRVLDEPDDLEVLIDGLGLLRHLAEQPALKQYIKAETAPGPAVTTREQLRAYVRATVVSGHHQIGTARMGVDSMSVVGPDLRLHGLTGLRIADASIMPTLTSGNTAAPVLMIGERAADFILTPAGTGPTAPYVA
ncbi:GMC family oxidoreductase [Actinoplanes sp. M2I2]|uniref:GMC family oxidoreductase n=1 Tax=Actinoplanes sp. M2I2 TaxID=1734444 RepID=UPI002020F5A3|nr:GMC family oxidoreductase N-terminal domain-containing protein [Actinoplanes sp. M2I2]